MHFLHINMHGACAVLKLLEIWKFSTFLNVIKFKAIYLLNIAQIHKRLDLHLDCGEN